MLENFCVNVLESLLQQSPETKPPQFYKVSLLNWSLQKLTIVIVIKVDLVEKT